MVDCTKHTSPRSAAPPRARSRFVVGIVLLWSGTVLWFSVTNLGDYLASTTVCAQRIALCAFCAASFWISGWRIVGRDPRMTALDPLARSTIELGIGVGAAMLAMFIAGIAGFVNVAAAWIILIVPFLGPCRAFVVDLRGRWSLLSDGASGRWPLLCIVAVVGIATLAESLAPAVSQDALVYHLAVPAKFVSEGSIHYVSGNFYSAFPMNVEMLFTIGLLIDGEEVAKWFHWFLAALSALSVAALARQLSPRGWRSTNGGGIVAAALFSTMPTVALIAAWAYVDLGVVFFSTLSTLCLVLELERRSGRPAYAGTVSNAMLVYAAVFAGLAAGCKYTAAIQGIIVAALVALDGARRRERFARVAGDFALAGAIAFSIVAPWYLKNWLTTGNPFFPFAYGLFGGAEWDAEKAFVLSQSLSEWGGSRSGIELLSLPWDVSTGARFFSQSSFDGVIGGAFLIGAPFLLAGLRLGWGFRVVALACAAHVASWTATTHQIRFLLPALALCAALLSISVCSLGDRRLRASVLAALHVVVLINALLVSVRFAAQNPLSVVLGLENRDRYMERALPGNDYAVFRHIEQELPADARILFGSCGNPGFLCKREYHSDAYFENSTLASILERASCVDELDASLRRAGFTHLLFRFDTVFDPSGRRSEIPLDDQLLFSRFLNERANLEFQADQTMLWRLTGLPPVAPRGAR